MFKFALRNISSKPIRAIFMVLAIAVAVAMIFSMLSIKDAIYSYIYTTETASSGDADILISTNSSSDRITQVTSDLKTIDNVEKIVPSLSLYALYGDEYVNLKGFSCSDIDALQSYTIISGSIDLLQNGINTDNVIISKEAADHFNLKVGSSVTLELSKQSSTFIVCAIAENSGYFISDAPYQFVSSIKNVSKLVSSTETELCNHIYIFVDDESKIDETIEEISKISTYESMLVEPAKDSTYINEQVNGLTAPIVLTGAAVLLLAIAIIFILFMSTESEKVNYAQRLKIVGATKKQIVLIFLIETLILSILGIAIGAGIGIGIFAGLIKLVLSKSMELNISVGFVFLAMGITFVVSVLSSLLPIIKSFKSSIRENIVYKKTNSKIGLIIVVILSCLFITSIIIESLINSITGIMAIVSAVLALLLVALGVPYILKALSNILKKSNIPEIRFSAVSILREKRFNRAITMLTMGMLIAMLLFMTWGLTTSMFTSYVNEFSDMIFITNIQSNVDVDSFKIDGVSDSTKLVWKQGEVSCEEFDKSMHLFGSVDILNMVDFEYITDETTALRMVNDKSNLYVLADIAINKLYGINVGDKLTVDIEGVQSDVIVGGFVKQNLFSGNYLIMNSDNVYNAFELKEDTVLIISDGDIDKTVENLRLNFANKNYYVLKTLDAYEWDMNSLDAVFDLIGTLAFIVAILTFIIIVSTTLISRGGVKKEINAYLNAGMSKSSMLKKELYEHTIVAFVSCVTSYVASIVITYSLIHALRLFGLYFDFMYNALNTALVGIVMGILYILLPVALNFKKSYNISKLNV